MDKKSKTKGNDSTASAADSPATALRKQGMLERAKKNVTGKVATSAVGKKLLAEVLPAAFKVLDFVKGIVTVLDGREKAKLVKRNLLKGSVKTALLYQSKALSLETLNELKLPVLRVWITFVEYCEAPETVDIAKLSEMIGAIFPRLRTELTGHVSPENLALFGDTFDYLASPSFLKRVFGVEPLTEIVPTTPTTQPRKNEKPQSKNEAKKEAKKEAKRVVQEAKKAEKLKMQEQKKALLQKKKDEAAAKKGGGAASSPVPTPKKAAATSKAKKPKKGVVLTIEERTERVVELRQKSGEYLRDYWETEITKEEKKMVRGPKTKKKKKKKSAEGAETGAGAPGEEKKKKKKKKKQQADSTTTTTTTTTTNA